jgi:sialate O-acetylesterase
MKHIHYGDNLVTRFFLTFCHFVYLRILVTAFLLLGFVVFTQASEVKLASYFGDHMVLQRGHKMCVWGTGSPGNTVEISIASQKAGTVVGADHRWKVCLQPMSAGGPYTLTVASGSEVDIVNDVFCGDVWLCSGQSNMQMPVKECVAKEQQATLADHPRLHLCTIGKGWNAKPQFSADIKWRVCTPGSARNFSAVGYFFASELLKDIALTNVPIGIIDSSFGGTTCEGWIPKPALASFNPKEIHDSMFGIKPTMLYNAMIAPLGGATFKGVVWYQGESNSGHPDTYQSLLSTMIAAWRKYFSEPDLPFFIVQLPDYASQWDGFYWPWEREAQAKVAQSTPDTFLVVGINTTDGFNLHPKTKLEIGRRIALAVRHDVYHENITGSGPVFKNATVEGSAIRVNFNPQDAGLASSSPGGVRGFAVAGENGVYHFANARIDGNSVIVRCAAVPAPQTVRYAWTGVPDSTLINKAGLPAAPFRTDDFPCSNVEVQREPVSHQVTTSRYKIVINGEGMVASLAVGDAQFISNDPGMAGGSSIPGLFGPIALPEDQELGPQLLSCSNGDFDFKIKFIDRSMEWTFTNKAKDKVNFNIALSSEVKISKPKNSDVVVLRCKGKTITFVGVDAASDSNSEKRLEIIINGNSTKNVTLNFD